MFQRFSLRVVILGLAYFAAGFSEEDVVIGIGIKRRIELNEIDAGIGEFFRVPQPRQVIAEVKAVRHLLDSA